MELNGEVVIQATRDKVWAALNDAAVLQNCIPGCEQVIDESPTVRQVKLMVKMGPVRARFQGRVTLSEVLEPERCVMAFEGSGGAAGMASGRSEVELIEDGDSTRLTYTVKASVGGKLGQIGGRMMDASAKQLADQFFTALREQLTALPVTEPVASDEVTSASMAAIQSKNTRQAKPTVEVSHRQPENSEFSRLLWFVMGVASTGFGVWLGARLL